MTSGGLRKGAGRPKTGRETISYHFRLTKEEHKLVTEFIANLKNKKKK